MKNQSLYKKGVMLLIMSFQFDPTVIFFLNRTAYLIYRIKFDRTILNLEDFTLRRRKKYLCFR